MHCSLKAWKCEIDIEKYSADTYVTSRILYSCRLLMVEGMICIMSYKFTVKEHTCWCFLMMQVALFESVNISLSQADFIKRKKDWMCDWTLLYATNYCLIFLGLFPWLFRFSYTFVSTFHVAFGISPVFHLAKIIESAAWIQEGIHLKTHLAVQ